jgi:hypothetical protein
LQAVHQRKKASLDAAKVAVAAIPVALAAAVHVVLPAVAPRAVVVTLAAATVAEETSAAAHPNKTNIPFNKKALTVMDEGFYIL